ncbi:LytR/AlgR family response regulator transcription factor [Fusibacter bizertensis]
MIKIAIVDDDFIYLEKLYQHLTQYEKDHDVAIQVTSYSNGFELISHFKPIYDIIFLDIEMPHLNGMEVAKEIRKSDPHAVIIFITNTAKYAINGYEVQAFDYMMKPIDYTQFAIKFGAAIDVMQTKEEFSILVPLEESVRNIKYSEIIFIEVRNHWLHIITKEGEYKMLGSLKEMNEKLVPYHFIMCNKSYLINLKHVLKMNSDSVLLSGNHDLKMSRAKRKEVQTAFMDYYHQMRW